MWEHCWGKHPYWVHSVTKPKPLERCLVHSRCSINICECWQIQRMNEIIKQLCDCSVPKILPTRYTLKFKEETCLFKPKVVWSLSLTEPRKSSEVWIHWDIFPNKRKVCLMNVPQEETAVPLTVNLSSFPKQIYAGNFFFYFLGHRAKSLPRSYILHGPLSAFHMGSHRNDLILTHSTCVKIGKPAIPNLSYVKPRCGGHARLPRMHTMQPGRAPRFSQY